MTARTLLVLFAFAVCGGEERAATGATVAGTLTLPGTASGKLWAVELLTGPGAVPIAEASGQTTGSTTLAYSLDEVPAGSYFLLGFVDVDGMGTTGSTPGDYAGWYGHTGDGNPPSVPNVIVPHLEWSPSTGPWSRGSAAVVTSDGARSGMPVHVVGVDDLRPQVGRGLVQLGTEGADQSY